MVLVVGLGAAGAAAEPELEVFTRRGCHWCERADGFVDALRREDPALSVAVRDVERDPAVRARLADLAARAGVRAGVPAFLVGGELVVGFRPGVTDVRVRALLAREIPVPIEGIETAFGRLDVRTLGLPVFTVALGLLDGVNPCAMWVLLFVLALLVNLHSRVRMLLIAGVFVAVSGIAYFAFMAAWLNVFLVLGRSRAIEVTLGLVAVAIGAINLKDLLARGHGPSLGIPEGAKPGIYARVRRIVQAENLAAALGGAVVLAILVNVLELACTAGLPVVYTRVLSAMDMPPWRHYAYLGLYNVAYVFDDAVILAVAVVTLGRFKLQERAGRWLKGLSGAVMLGLGVALLAGAL